jgi:rhodanese-related sulfurtransferase
MIIKAIADRKTHMLLGVQIVGFDGVDKRMDVFVTAMTALMRVEDLAHLDLAYAPPFSTTKDPVMYTGMILENALDRGRALIRKEELAERAPGDVSILDMRSEVQYAAGHIPNAKNVPHEKLREALCELDPDKPVITYCNKGTTGNAAQNILLNHGFKEVYNLSGGFSHYSVQSEKRKDEEEKIRDAETTGATD